MVLRFSVFIIILLLVPHAYSQLKCLGKAQDPQKSFYASKLIKIIEYIEKAPQRLTQLEERNTQIEKRIKELNSTLIPSTKKQLSGEGIVYRETEMTEVNLAERQAVAKAARTQRNIRAENIFKQKSADLQKRTETLEKNRKASRIAFSTAQNTLTQERLSILEKYEADLSHIRRNTTSRKKDAILKKQSKSDIEKIESDLAAQEALLEATKEKNIEKIDSELIKLEERRTSALSLLEAEDNAIKSDEAAAKEEFEAAKEESQRLYSAAGRAAVKNEARRLQRIKNPIADRLARFQEELTSLETELDQNKNGKPIPQQKRGQPDPETRPEQYLDFHGIKQLQENVGQYQGRDYNGNPLFSTDGKFEMIKRWWNEQGKRLRNTKIATEAKAECDNCSPVKLLPASYHGSLLKKECVTSSISTLSSNTTQYKCEDENQPDGIRTNDECVTDELADYTQWSINNALKCISPSHPDQEIDPSILALKINRESNFNNSYCYAGGCGLMQMTTCARDEMMGCSPSPHCCDSNDSACRARATCNVQSSGRKFMADILSNKTQQLTKGLKDAQNPCLPYKSIFDFEKEKESIDNNVLDERRLFGVGMINKCQSLSLEQGMHRNILNGIGLYLFYRDHGDSSATNLLKTHLGLDKNSPDFKKMRDYFALGMYGANGNTGAEIIFRNLLPELKRKSKNGLTFEEFKEIVSGPKGIQYLTDIEKSANMSFSENGKGEPQCAAQ